MTRNLLYSVEKKFSSLRLDEFLATKDSELFSRSFAKKLIGNGNIFVNGKRIEKPAFLVTEHDIVETDWKKPEKKEFSLENIPKTEKNFGVVFEDNEILVVNKPAGMCVHPDPFHANGTLLDEVKSYLSHSLEGVGDNPERPGIVHRIDKNTSGLVMIAKTPQMHRFLTEKIANREVHKEYKALVFGRLPSNEGTIDSPIFRSQTDRKKMEISLHSHARNAVTHFALEEEFKKPLVSLVNVQIITGRTHQIRVHFSALGLPLVMDDIYGNETLNKDFSEKFPLQRIFLHAEKISLQFPNGEKKIFYAPTPADLEKTLEKLQFLNNGNTCF